MQTEMSGALRGFFLLVIGGLWLGFALFSYSNGAPQATVFGITGVGVLFVGFGVAAIAKTLFSATASKAVSKRVFEDVGDYARPGEEFVADRRTEAKSEEFDPDAALARYLARKNAVDTAADDGDVEEDTLNDVAEVPTFVKAALAAPSPVAPVFGRKAMGG